MTLDELLKKLHLKTAEELLKRIESGEATAAEFTAAVNFLKANGIESVRGANKSLDTLAARLLAVSLPDQDQPNA